MVLKYPPVPFFLFLQHHVAQTYPRPSEGQEPPLVPVLHVHEEQPRDHHEHPHHEVDDVQHVVEAHRVLHSQSHDHRHQQRNQQSQQVRVRLLPFTWRTGFCLFGLLVHTCWSSLVSCLVLEMDQLGFNIVASGNFKAHFNSNDNVKNVAFPLKSRN